MPEATETTKASKPVSTGESAAPAKSGGGYGARAGEVITGNLARGNDGKFTSAGNTSAAKPVAKPTTTPARRQAANPLKRKPLKPKKGRAAAKPKKGPKGPDPAKARAAAQRRAEVAARRAQREADKKKRDQEAQQKKLDRAVQNELKKREQLAKRDEAATKREQRAAERAKRRAAADLKKQAAANTPKGGGGKGGAKPKPDKAIAAAENRAKVGTALGVDTAALGSLADGTQPDPASATALTAAGLINKNRDGTYSTTASGRAVLNAAERGDERQARAMLARGRDTQAGRDEQRARTEARTRERESRAAQREVDKKKRGRERRKSFAVFKDHAGHLRWLAVSSTAFQDRDGEIVSVKALEDDVARSDATGQYGPLRFWHVPGLDIGDCDFRAVHGRSLIESGTFRDDRYAAIIKDKDQVSLGWLHTLDQPTPEKVFEDIYTFERSVVPFPEGRGSNLFTRLVVKEAQMLTEAKKAALASRVGPDILAELLAGVEATEKAADEAGVRFKDASRVAVWDESIGGWAEVTTKAPADEGETVEIIEDEPDAPNEEPVDESGGYFTPEELAEITAAIAPAVAAAVIEQLSPMLNMEAKMSKFTDELKGMVAPQLAQKDAAIAEQTAALAAVKAEAEAINTRLKELEGDQPRGAGYRPSEAKDNLVGEGSTLKSAQPTADPNFLQFFNFGQ